MSAFQPGDRVEVCTAAVTQPGTVVEVIPHPHGTRDRPGLTPAYVVAMHAGPHPKLVVVLADRCRPLPDADPVGPDHVVQAG